MSGTYPGFDRRFRDWVAMACAAWGYDDPHEEYYDKFYSRIPVDCQQQVVEAIEQGVVLEDKFRFRVIDGRGGHGPYAWFSKDRGNGPGPNWEYFVEVSEFLRAHQWAASHEMVAYFEYPGEVDVSLYRADKIMLVCEVKEHVEVLRSLLTKLKRYEPQVNVDEPDRGNDPLRKAKYIVRARPEWFRAVAIGYAEEFRVTYPEGRAFQLERDVFPWDQLQT